MDHESIACLCVLCSTSLFREAALGQNAGLTTVPPPKNLIFSSLTKYTPEVEYDESFADVIKESVHLRRQVLTGWNSVEKEVGG